jgi:DNA-binding NarL/FixJ family response regulator
MRLRRALMSDASAAPDGEAVLGPDGKLHHAVGPATERTAREVLRAAVVASERARGPRRREDPDRALADWRALVAGRWSLVDRFERDGRRYVVARRNDPDVPDPRGLTRRERQVAAYAVLGRSGQAIAYELGLARSTVVQHLASAMKKLSVATRAELAQLVRPGSGSPTPSNPNK